MDQTNVLESSLKMVNGEAVVTSTVQHVMSKDYVMRQIVALQSQQRNIVANVNALKGQYDSLEKQIEEYNTILGQFPAEDLSIEEVSEDGNV